MANLGLKVADVIKKFYDVKEVNTIRGMYEVRELGDSTGDILWYFFSSNNATYHKSANDCIIRDINQSNSKYIDRLKAAYEKAKSENMKIFWLVLVYGEAIGLIPSDLEWMASIELKVNLDSITASLSMRRYPVGKTMANAWVPCCKRVDQDKYFNATFISCKDGNGNFTSEYMDPYFSIFDNRPYHDVIPVDDEDDAVIINVDSSPLTYQTGFTSRFSRNRIVFGAPGTGKSYGVNSDRKELLGEDNDENYERVTFHPDYSYANFVGTYKPVPFVDSDGKDAITYEYVPGPFMRTLVKALKSACEGENQPYLLIIEEINRANVAAVFGDVFQLLDRAKNGVSEYPIQTSEDIKKYLAKTDVLGGNKESYSQIRIPDNMYIWATMNSADQGVFPMDTAFKRRWDFTYIGIDDNDEAIEGKTVVLGKSVKQKVEWNKLRKAINNFLADQKINEDKQLGPYFLSKDIVIPEVGDEIDAEKFIAAFKNKVIMYLFEDAAKQKQASLFEGCFSNSRRYSEICKEFDDKGIGIFCSDIQNEADPIDISLSGDDSTE